VITGDLGNLPNPYRKSCNITVRQYISVPTFST
jgi:hypothetical protein